MSSLRQLIQRGLQQCGLELSTVAEAHKVGLRPDVEALIKAVQPATLFDVGANQGQFKKFAREEVGFAGKIISFEPIPDLAMALTERSKTDPLWQVVPCALGAEPATLNLNVSANSAFSSFLPQAESVGHLFPEAAATRTVEVPVQTLSAFFRSQSVSTPYFLKLDTQGFDLQVINGGLDVLRDCAAVLCEVSVIPLYAGQPTWREMIDRLEALGFGMVGLYPVNRTPFMQVIEFDCLMINQRFAPRDDR